MRKTNTIGFKLLSKKLLGFQNLQIEEIKRRISHVEDSLRDKLSEKMFSDEIEKVYIETAKVKVTEQVL
jgi:hypothetical protein